MKALIAALALAAAASSPSFAADAANGKKVFTYWCATCHGATPGERGMPLPGTMSLQNKYAGAKPAVLEQRDDLVPIFVQQVVRHGSEGMPFFRKTEISNAQLDDIAAYLAKPPK